MAEPDLIDRIGADDPDAYALGSDLLDRDDQAFTVASDLIAARLGVQHDRAHVEVNDGLSNAARLDDLGVAVDEYRERRSNEVVEELASMLGRSSVVSGATARYVIAGLRAVVERTFRSRRRLRLRRALRSPLPRDEHHAPRPGELT